MAAKKVPKPKRKGGNKYSGIVGNLITPPAKPLKSFWPREVKLAKDLCDKYGFEKVSAWCPKYPYPSIAYLLAAVEDIEDRIERNWVLFNSKNPERFEYELSEAPVADHKPKSFKKNTIKSWLKQ